MIKVRAKISEIKNRKTVKKINETWFFAKIDEIDKLLGKLTKQKEKIQK